MRYNFVAAQLASIACVLAAPAPQGTTIHARANSNAGFSVAQVASGQYLLNGAAEVAKTYAKYGVTVPDNVVNAAASKNGSVTATPDDEYDSAYLCPVQIGTPPVTMHLDFDTGSSDLWVFSGQLSAKAQKGHDIYKPKKSTSATLVSGEKWDISYEDGSGASGKVYTDIVNIGGVEFALQDVEIATSVSASFVSETNDGLVGLGFDSLNTCSPKKCKTFMDNVSGNLSLPLFTSNLQYHAAGQYDFGYIDTTQYSGDISYVDLDEATYWEFTATGYGINGTTTTHSLPNSIGDTGTTLLYLPDVVVKAYYAQVTGSSDSSADGGWVFPCTSTLPDLSLEIGGAYHTVPGEYMNYAPVNSKTCFGGLQSSAAIGENILGDVFLKSQFIVWDYGNKRFGVAAKAT